MVSSRVGECPLHAVGSKMKTRGFLILATAVACVAGCGRVNDKPVEAAAPASDYVSPEFLAVGRDGKTVYASCATAQRIMVQALDGAAPRAWRVETTKTAKPVPVNPTGIAADTAAERILKEINARK